MRVVIWTFPFVAAMSCSFDDVTRDVVPVDRVVIVDTTGRDWDITQAVVLYGFAADGFTGGFGAFATVPVLNPAHRSPGDAGYPDPADTFEVVSVSLGTDRAYALDTLASVVAINDLHDQILTAIVYDTPSATARAYRRSVGGEPATLAASGWEYGGRSVYFDYETESLWYRVGGADGLTCVNGERLHAFLATIPSQRVRWSDWRTGHPATLYFGSP